MKKILLLITCCISMLVLSAAPSITMQNNNADSDIAEYIQDALKDKLASTNCSQVKITLTQNGDALTISYSIDNSKAKGTESTSNIWNDLDNIIEKVAYSIKSSVQPASTTSTTTPHTAQPQPTANQNPSQTRPVPSSQNAVSNMISNLIKDYTLDDVKAGRAAVGGLLTFPDGTSGIIYYLDGHAHGLVVSLNRTFAKWENVNRSRDCHDILMLPNEDGIKACTYGVGATNTETIINQIGAQNAPAAQWCIGRGDGWYLPSSGELWHLLTIANGGVGAAGVISIALAARGGSPLDKKWYWSSTENDKDEAINVSSWGSMSSEDKDEILPVYAVRAF